jgi:hypothetical protein
MPDPTLYKGYEIKLTANKDKSGRWVASWRAWRGGDSVGFGWDPQLEGSPTQEEAEAYALADARAWIDRALRGG